MKNFAIILSRNNIVQTTIKAPNMGTSNDGYVVEIPLDSTVKQGDIYNPTTQEFTIVEIPIEEIE